MELELTTDTDLVARDYATHCYTSVFLDILHDCSVY